jgi:MFS family permease
MTSFDNRMGSATSDPGTKGWLVAILELGAWFGVLVTGYLADKLSRKYTIVLGMYPRSNSVCRVDEVAVCYI